MPSFSGHNTIDRDAGIYRTVIRRRVSEDLNLQQFLCHNLKCLVKVQSLSIFPCVATYNDDNLVFDEERCQ